jgi:predicted RNA binding protein YcfA (HicA-like mRNA interferase family)
MKSAEVIRRLKAHGWVLDRVKGSHHQFKKAGEVILITVPHPEKDIPTGTLRNIYRCAGWNWN